MLLLGLELAPLHFITHVQDITDRLADEENLRRYENIVSLNHDAVSLLDRSYRYRIVNKRMNSFPENALKIWSASRWRSISVSRFSGSM